MQQNWLIVLLAICKANPPRWQWNVLTPVVTVISSFRSKGFINAVLAISSRNHEIQATIGKICLGIKVNDSRRLHLGDFSPKTEKDPRHLPGIRNDVREPVGLYYGSSF